MKPWLVLVLLAPLALATHPPSAACRAGNGPAVGLVQLFSGDDAFYVDDRGGDLAVYEGSNGLWVDGDAFHSLQRGAKNPLPVGQDPCVEDPRVPPDSAIIEAAWLG